MAINDATANFRLMHLEGSDTAGYNSINALITDIDNELYARVAVPGMVIMWRTAAGAVPPGWTDVTSTLTGAGAATITGYKYIEKAST
jgi:hypothetical protein